MKVQYFRSLLFDLFENLQAWLFNRTKHKKLRRLRSGVLNSKLRSQKSALL